MNYIIDMKNMKHKCRVCLTPSNQMISLACKLDEQNHESPLIYIALENIFSTKVPIDSNYPEGVCLTCYRQIKTTFSLKTVFNKSQYILQQCLSESNSGSNPKDSSDENYINILQIHSEGFIKDEFNEGEELTDFVILQVTDDNEEEVQIKEEHKEIECFEFEKSVEEQIENNLTLEEIEVESLKYKGEECIKCEKTNIELFDPTKFKIEKIIRTSKILYSCPFCDKRLLTKRKLDQHAKICQKYTLEKCEFCDQQFSSLMRKLYHIKIKHNSDTKEVKCQSCNEVFDNLKACSYHTKTKHASKEFSCKVCGKAFHFKNGLATHMDTHSKGTFREICPVCGKGFHYKGGLFYHMKIHKGERNYLCTYCSARFLNLSGLKKHIRIHTGEKPCQCEYCGKSFRSTSILKKHEKTHTGHRPHSCEYCGKGFISTYNLKVHTAGHSGDQPCAFCDRSFLNEEVLKLHMKFKHNIKEVDIKSDDSE